MSAFQVVIPVRVADHHTLSDCEIFGVKDCIHRQDSYVMRKELRLYKHFRTAKARAIKENGFVTDYNAQNKVVFDATLH